MIVRVNGVVLTKTLEAIGESRIVDTFVDTSRGLDLSILNKSISIIATATRTVGTENLSTLGERIREIFNPVMDVLASLGYPVTYGMLIVGGLMIITGRKRKGFDVIKWASIGYVGVQFVPFILNLLEMIGRALREGMY